MLFRLEVRVFVLVHIKRKEVILFQVSSLLQAPFPIITEQKSEANHNYRREAAQLPPN